MAEDMQLMQQEAARRVRRMQEHTRRVFEEHSGRTIESLRAAQPPHYQPPPLYHRPVEEEKPHEEPCVPGLAQQEPPAGSLLGGFDTEQILLLGLALLLFRCGCRVELILALLYLAM